MWSFLGWFLHVLRNTKLICRNVRFSQNHDISRIWLVVCLETKIWTHHFNNYIFTNISQLQVIMFGRNRHIWPVWGEFDRCLATSQTTFEMPGFIIFDNFDRCWIHKCKNMFVIVRGSVLHPLRTPITRVEVTKLDFCGMTCFSARAVVITITYSDHHASSHPTPLPTKKIVSCGCWAGAKFRSFYDKHVN